MKKSNLRQYFLGAVITFYAMNINAAVIDMYPDPTLPTLGVYSPLGEVSNENQSLSINSHHDFATYFAQSFEALPGLAQDLTFNIRGGNGDDGIDFRVLIAETAASSSLFTPTNVIYSSLVFTLGPQIGFSGSTVSGSDVTINLGGLDLVDGAVYSWILDTISTADGIEGYGSVGYRHPAQVNIFGNSSVLVQDLELEVPNQPWINVDYIDLVYRLTFSDGGISNPSHTVLEHLPSAPEAISEPDSVQLFVAGLIVFAVAKSRHNVNIIICHRAATSTS